MHLCKSVNIFKKRLEFFNLAQVSPRFSAIIRFLVLVDIYNSNCFDNSFEMNLICFVAPRVSLSTKRILCSWYSIVNCSPYCWQLSKHGSYSVI